MVATRKADGTIGYACLHGLATADHQVTSAPVPAPVSKTAVLEEK